MHRSGGCVAVAVAVLLLASSVGRAGDAGSAQRQMEELLASLERSEDPGERKELVRRLGRTDLLRAAERLRRIVRTDPDPSVRVEAAKALGVSPVAEALGFLLELTVEGGPRDVRRALGRSVARRSGRDALLRRLTATEDTLGRGLLVEALAEDLSEAGARELERMARGDDRFLRVESLRRLARHPAAAPRVANVLCEVLLARHDLDTVLAGLDVAESLADADFRVVAQLLDTFLEPEVQGAVEAARRRLAWIDAADAARRAARDGYAPFDGDPPEPPAPRPRIDIVFAFDATGSVTGHVGLIKERIRRETRTLARVGSDVRIGVVAYRDLPRRRDSWATRVLPLTYDLAAAEAWIDSVSVGGCDSQGACITEALEQAMGRMGWRWAAQRQVALIADSRTGDPERSGALVRLHHQADDTRLHVWYLFRTRPKVPPDVAALARWGGGVVESLE